MLKYYRQKARRTSRALVGQGAIGFIDRISVNGIYGWAIDRPFRRKALITIRIDGAPVDATVETNFRPDIAALYGNGNFGFRIKVPAEWRDGRSHKVQVFAGRKPVLLPFVDGLEQRFRFGMPVARVEDFPKMKARLLKDALIQSGTGFSGQGPVALFACHSADGDLSYSQRNLLNALSSQGCRTIVCQSSLKGGQRFLDSVAPLCSDAIVRTDYGRDFASWAILLDHFESVVRAADYLILINDSFYCIEPDLSPLFKKFNPQGLGLFGVTDSYQQSYHLQSSVLFATRAAANHKALWTFFRQYPFPENREDVVACGELTLTRYLQGAGFDIRVLLPVNLAASNWLKFTRIHPFFDQNGQDVVKGYSGAIRNGLNVNPQHLFWRQILEDAEIPLIKNELLTLNPGGVPDIQDVFDVVNHNFGHEAMCRMQYTFSSIYTVK